MKLGCLKHGHGEVFAVIFCVGYFVLSPGVFFGSVRKAVRQRVYQSTAIIWIQGRSNASVVCQVGQSAPRTICNRLCLGRVDLRLH